MPKSWIEKRDCKRIPQVKVLDKPFAGMKQGCRMLISSPLEIDAFIRAIPPGQCITPAQMRAQLAEKHEANATCPLTTGIFLRIVSEAALEEHANGKGMDEITPFWRIAIEGTATATKISIREEELQLLRKREQEDSVQSR